MCPASTRGPWRLWRCNQENLISNSQNIVFKPDTQTNTSDFFFTQGDTAGQVWEWGGWGESGKIIKAFHENCFIIIGSFEKFSLIVDYRLVGERIMRRRGLWSKIYFSGFGEGCQQDIQGKI